MDTLTVEDLKSSPDRLVGDAARGEAALVVDQGRPLLFALPVDETLLTHGAKLALAVKLFDQDLVGLEGAARIAGISQSEMIDHLGALHIPVVRYSTEELKAELDNLERFAGR
ncbi:UPF0175 family protein [Acidithiobacillus sulfuriphilus]|uniref:UPF0175 family protein n=2 Tax=Acidithiobacillus sulfuriphilus TaxID=1867749 RepID=A0A3M8QSN9_9PROT|nr:UPF0175 family protein [Acidithiobacillus sulfuriphilus]RNF59319.1 UPF0175 family protein [Acidithiobacillus sulfuriphilus]